MIPIKVFNIFQEIIPMIILFVIVTLTLTVIKIFYCKEKINLYKELKNLLYIIYLFILFYLVTTSDFESYSNNFVLFKEITRYNITSKLFFRNVIGNIILFIPFGFIITDIIHELAKKCNFFISSIVIIITSLSTEIIQMFIGRSFDCDDILLNYIGGLIGYLLFFIIHKIFYKYNKDNYIIKTILLLLLVIIIIGAFYLSYKVGIK